MIWLAENGKITKNNILLTDKGADKAREKCWSDYISCLQNSEYPINLLRMFHDEEYQTEIIKRLYKGVDKTDFDYLVKMIWLDYYLFATELQEHLIIKIKKEYEISKLQEIEKLSIEADCPSDAGRILRNLQTAENNTRILKLRNELFEK